MSRHEIPSKQPGFIVSVGWDNPMATFFAEVESKATPDDQDPVVLSLGRRPREVLRPEDMVAPLAPYAELTSAHLEQLRADRMADLDHGPSPLQRLGIFSWTLPDS